MWKTLVAAIAITCVSLPADADSNRKPKIEEDVSTFKTFTLIPTDSVDSIIEYDVKNKNVFIVTNKVDKLYTSISVIRNKNIPPECGTLVEHTTNYGSYQFEWCDFAPPISGKTNLDVYLSIGGGLFLIGSSEEDCEQVPTDVKNGPACNGEPPS